MLRQLDPVTVVCGAVVVLGFLALGVLKWAEHPHWPGFAGSGGEDDGDRDSQPFVPQAGSMQDRPVSAATEFGPRPPPPQRRNRNFTPDGRDKRLMPTAEWQEWLSTLDPNKANTDRSPSYNAEQEFYRGRHWWALKARFKREIEAHDPTLWRCWADQDGDCWGRVNVDHIRPVSLFWSRRGRMGNFQPLCERHNDRKGNSQPLDYRPTWLKQRYPP